VAGSVLLDELRPRLSRDGAYRSVASRWLKATVAAGTIARGPLSSETRSEAPIKKPPRHQVRIGADDPRVARAIFTLRETAAYLGIPKSTIQWWARPPDAAHSLITCFPSHGRQATVPFIGFAEAFVLSSFRRAGVPLQRIRPAVEVLAKEIGIEHALASDSLYTDGAEVLFDYASKHGEREVMELVVVRTQQRQFSEVVKDYLKRISYGGDGWAESVRLTTYENANVIVDFSVPPGQVEDVIRVATRAAA
jgi:hypothetical protein